MGFGVDHQGEITFGSSQTNPEVNREAALAIIGGQLDRLGLTPGQKTEILYKIQAFLPELSSPDQKESNLDEELAATLGQAAATLQKTMDSK